MNPYSQPTLSTPSQHQPPPSPPHLHQLSFSNTPLHQPIAIPSTSPSLGSPFLRAYPPSLLSYSLPAPLFLSFLDELNRLMVLSPPLRALSLAGSIVGTIPLATAQIVGGAVNAAATLGQIGMSKGLSAKFIRKANEEIFAPRGLKVDVVGLEDVARAAGMEILDDKGKIRKDVKVLPAMEDLRQDLSGQERRLVAIEEYTSALHVMPEEYQDVPDNLFGEMHTRASERQREKEEAKVLDRRSKGHGKHHKDTSKAQQDYDKEMSKLDNEEAKTRRKEARKPEKLEHELSKIEREREKVKREYEKEMGKARGGRHGKDKEEAAMRQILWLLIQRKDVVAPRTRDTTERWSSSRQYGEHMESYRAERQAQGELQLQQDPRAVMRPGVAQSQGAGQQIDTGPYLGGGQYRGYEEQTRTQSRMQYQVAPGYDHAPPY